MPSCPMLMNTGACTKPGCSFSHSLAIPVGSVAGQTRAAENVVAEPEMLDRSSTPSQQPLARSQTKNQGLRPGLEEPRGPQSPLRKKSSAQALEAPWPLSGPESADSGSDSRDEDFEEDEVDVRRVLGRPRAVSYRSVESTDDESSESEPAERDEEDDDSGDVQAEKDSACRRRSKRSITLCVKNTFLDFQEEPEALDVPPLPPRSCSANF